MVLVEGLKVGGKKDEFQDESDERDPFPIALDIPTTNTHIHALIIDKLTCSRVEKMS